VIIDTTVAPLEAKRLLSLVPKTAQNYDLQVIDVHAPVKKIVKPTFKQRVSILVMLQFMA
jgi:hypothetical protein